MAKYTSEQLIAIGALMEYRAYLTRYLEVVNANKWETPIEEVMAEGMNKLVNVFIKELDSQIARVK